MGKLEFTLKYKCGHQEGKSVFFSGEMSDDLSLKYAMTVNNALYKNCPECDRVADSEVKSIEQNQLLKTNVIVKMPYWEYKKHYSQFPLLNPIVVNDNKTIVDVLMPDKLRQKYKEDINSNDHKESK